MSKLTDNIENRISKDIEDLGYEIEYTEYVKEGSQNIFRIVIDKKDTSLTTEDCEIVSKKVEDKVDSLMKDDKSYVLEVSSPGLERNLKTKKLYDKYLGYNIRVKLFKKIDDTKEIEGILEESEDDYIVLRPGSSELKIKIKRDNISAANTVYDFGEE